jgi:hypothetical protein
VFYLIFLKHVLQFGADLGGFVGLLIHRHDEKAICESTWAVRRKWRGGLESGFENGMLRL